MVGCLDRNDPALFLEDLSGAWIETFHCTNQQCRRIYDSLQVTRLEIGEDTFTATHFKDGNQQYIDTTFSGKISISSDTLQFILSTFKEVFQWRLINNRLLLVSAYMIDSKGNHIVDFRSLLWCCDVKKRGFFE